MREVTRNRNTPTERVLLIMLSAPFTYSTLLPSGRRINTPIRARDDSNDSSASRSYLTVCPYFCTTSAGKRGGLAV